MNFGDMQKDLDFNLNANEDQVDQAFSSFRKKRLLNQAYKRETERAKQHGSSAWFKWTIDLTWLESAATLTVPRSLAGTTILTAYEVLSTGLLGTELDIVEGYTGSGYSYDTTNVTTSTQTTEVFWKDLRTLQWGNTAGPTQDTNLRFTFIAQAEEMDDDTDEPLLVPPQHHELIVLAASCWARSKADGGIPADWKEELEYLRLDFAKFVSRGRPAGANTWFDSSRPYPYK